MKYPTFLVGGAVRDELMGLPCKDKDFVMLAPSFDAMREAIKESGCKIFLEKPEYLTIRAKHPQFGSVDFAVARRDGTYTDGRHPDATTITADLKQDLARRDFTMNAIAKNVVTGELVDPFNGYDDIEDKVIRCVGKPLDRFNEDRLRIFRAVRFAVQKDFNIDSLTSSTICYFSSIRDFEAISTERIREEMLKMFVSNGKLAMRQLTVDYPTLWDVIEDRQIWLKPTLEKR